MKRTLPILIACFCGALSSEMAAASEHDARDGVVLRTVWNEVSSDTVDSARERFIITLPETVTYRMMAVGLPGSSISSPTAYGADFRDVFAVAVYQRRARYASGPDGAAAVGFGVGDAQAMAGLEFVFTNFNLFTEPDRGEVRDVSLSMKLHRLITSSLSVAVGVENAMALRGQIGDSGTSYYGVVTNTFRISPTTARAFQAITVSAGLGNGRFRYEFHQPGNEDYRFNVFGSAGVRVTRAVSAVVDWTGVDLNAGMSVAPMRDIPLIVTAAFADLTGRTDDNPRLIIGVGFGHSF